MGIREIVSRFFKEYNPNNRRLDGETETTHQGHPTPRELGSKREDLGGPEEVQTWP